MICISPIGEVHPDLIRILPKEIEKIFGFGSEAILLLRDIEFALDPGRHQYHSTAILERLAGQAPNHSVKIVGLTTVDLFIPILTYVYGEAQLGGKACIVSTHRLNETGTTHPGKPPLTDRLIKEVIHELGHTFKLRHCPERRCVMHYARCIDDVDRKSEGLCRHCRVLVEDEKKRMARRDVSDVFEMKLPGNPLGK
jgi:archaemetzincin